MTTPPKATIRVEDRSVWKPWKMVLDEPSILGELTISPPAPHPNNELEWARCVSRTTTAIQRADRMSRNMEP